MIIPHRLAGKYANVIPFVRAAGDRVGDVLRVYCRDNLFAYTDRIKSLESTAEKIETGRFRSWDELDDLYAGTVIIPLITQEDEVVRFLEETFVIQDIRRRGSATKSPEHFRFDATKVTARLKCPDALDEERALSISSVLFEIQVKTAFEFAWGTTTHALSYKSGNIDWRRRRLAAHLKAAVEQLDMMVLGYDTFVRFIEGCTWPSLDDHQRIMAFFKGLIADGALPDEYEPKDWTRCAENLYVIFLMYAGRDPETMQSRQLQELEEYLSHIDRDVRRMGIRQVPRSLSLVQFVHGLMGSAYVIDERFASIPILGQDELKDLFPQYHARCPAFML